MNTLTNQGAMNVHHAKNMKLHLTPAFWASLEAKRFAIVPVLLLLTACTGGIAAAFGAIDSTFQLALTAFPTIISLALVLGVAPMKAIVYLSAVSIVLDLLVLLF